MIMSNIVNNKTFETFISKSKNIYDIETMYKLWEEHKAVFPIKSSSYYSVDYQFINSFKDIVAQQILYYDREKNLHNNAEKLNLLVKMGIDIYLNFYKKRRVAYFRYDDLLIALEASDQYELIKKHKINIYDQDYVKIKFNWCLANSNKTFNNTVDIFKFDGLPLTYEKLTKIRNDFGFKSDIWLDSINSPCIFRAYVQDGNKVSNEQIKKAFVSCFILENNPKRLYENQYVQHTNCLEDFVHGFSQTNQFKSNIMTRNDYVGALKSFFADEIKYLESKHKGTPGSIKFWSDSKDEFFYHPVFKFGKLDKKMKEKAYIENFGKKFVSNEQEKLVEKEEEMQPIKKKVKI